MTDLITTADEFFDAYVRDGVYDQEAGSAALDALHIADREAFYRLMTSEAFVSRCIQNAHLFTEGLGATPKADLTEDQEAEIDALLDEAEELEERAAHLRAKADALWERNND
jgi:hypothetical protein